MSWTVRKWMTILKWLAILMAIVVFLSMLGTAYMSAPRRVEDEMLTEWLEKGGHGNQNTDSDLKNKLTDIVEDKYDVNITGLVIDVHDAIMCKEFCVTIWYKSGVNGYWYVTSLTDSYLKSNHRSLYDEIDEKYA